jgi:hypothetical protein
MRRMTRVHRESSGGARRSVAECSCALTLIVRSLVSFFSSSLLLLSVSIVGVYERVVWREMGPQMGEMIVEHPEALLLPAKPTLTHTQMRAYPAHQQILQTQQQHGADTILQVRRQ